jgi:parallel beta-helix repeat protein
VISGNTVGMSLDNNAIDNTVIGNVIGRNAAGTAAVPNESDGIGITNGSFNTIGGTATGAGNVIANNGPSIVKGSGIFVQAGTGNTFVGNSIFGNTLLGIDLGDDGVTANDADDPDSGPNDLQNFPVVKTAVAGASSLLVTGTLESQPRTTFSLAFYSNGACDPSGSGEGRTFLGAKAVTTGFAGTATFSATFPVTVAAGQQVTATATNPNGSTSEFSACRVVT